MDSISLMDMFIENFLEEFGFFHKEVYKKFSTEDFYANAQENDFIEMSLVYDLYSLRQQFAKLPMKGSDYSKLRVKELKNTEHLLTMAREFKKGSFLISRGTVKFSEMFRSLFDIQPFDSGLFIFDGEAPGGAVFSAAERWKWTDRPSKWPYLAVSLIEDNCILAENKDTFVRFLKFPESSSSFRGDILSENDTKELVSKADKRCLVYTFDGAYNSSDEASFEKDMLEFCKNSLLRAQQLLQHKGCALIKTYLTRELKGLFQVIIHILPFFETIEIIKPPSSPLLNREIYIFLKNKLEIQKKCEDKEIFELQKKIHIAVINTISVLSFLIKSDWSMNKKINLMEKLYKIRLDKCQNLIANNILKIIPSDDNF